MILFFYSLSLTHSLQRLLLTVVYMVRSVRELGREGEGEGERGPALRMEDDERGLRADCLISWKKMQSGLSPRRRHPSIQLNVPRL